MSLTEQALINKIKLIQADPSQEHNKFDFKKKWYDLTVLESRCEMLKDCAAIANSYGFDDGFILFGFDGAAFFDTKTTDSGMSDPAHIGQLIQDNISPFFIIDIQSLLYEGKRLTYIHIPRTSNKPHLVLKYKGQTNVIFTRNASSTTTANRGSLDLMYWERRHEISDHRAIVGINSNYFLFKRDGEELIGEGFLYIENAGSRVLSISKIELEVVSLTKSFVFDNKGQFGSKNIEITPQQIYSNPIRFVDVSRPFGREYVKDIAEQLQRDFSGDALKMVRKIVLTLYNGQRLEAELSIFRS